MPESNESFWTEERVDFLREWRERGASSREIANALSTTKGAVAGKCSRLNLPLNVKRGGPPEPPAFAPRRSLADIPATEIDEEASKWLDAPKPKAKPLIPAPILDRKTNQCAAVLFKRGRNGLALMCGQPTIPRPTGLPSPWCAEHYQLYYRKDDYGQTGSSN